eukprot:NODE_6825_length_487_cov_13.623288_g6031_i0.p1 GENE.NODE_6825_length_487_cov_13.623288_g6031_i0~~NODE_6825_length_487_cov_13.623288_g6031_i0.p1  ORF type:complete len:107 (+),score=36.55 NODE_6825_length_487_cov_13.623288_g6031_i0:35-322(+)
MGDENGDGLLTDEELRQAAEKDPALKERLNVLAVNLAMFSRKGRHASKYDQEVQKRLDELASQMDDNMDGLLSATEIRAASPEVKSALRSIGILI